MPYIPTPRRALTPGASPTIGSTGFAPSSGPVRGSTGYTPSPASPSTIPTPEMPNIDPYSGAAGGVFFPQAPKPGITEAPSEFITGLHQTLQSMGTDEQGTFLQAMREKLLQKVYRWQTAIARGLQPDESAMADFESSKSALADIQRYLAEPEFAEAATDYAAYMKKFETKPAQPRPYGQAL